MIYLCQDKKEEGKCMDKRWDGVEILLERGTVIPSPIRRAIEYATSYNANFGPGRIRILRILRGEARFGHRGIVSIKMPESDRWTEAFNCHSVLQIRDFRGRVLERNWLLCEKCFTTRGECTGMRLDSENPRLPVRLFQCTGPTCGNRWEIRG